MNKPTPPKPPEPRQSGNKNNLAPILVGVVLILLMFVVAPLVLIRDNLKTKQVDVVVVDKYEGLKHGTTAFFIQTCLKDDMKRCELDTIYRSEWDMIEIGEQWTLEVKNAKY